MGWVGTTLSVRAVDKNDWYSKQDGWDWSMVYGNGIINGILSLIHLEPCHSPTDPSEGRRGVVLGGGSAAEALTDLSRHSFLGFHITSCDFTFPPLRNETVPDILFIFSSLPTPPHTGRSWCLILCCLPLLLRGSCYWCSSVFFSLFFEPSNGKYWILCLKNLALPSLSLLTLTLSLSPLGTKLVKHFRLFLVPHPSPTLMHYLLLVDAAITDFWNLGMRATALHFKHRAHGETSCSPRWIVLQPLWSDQSWSHRTGSEKLHKLLFYLFFSCIPKWSLSWILGCKEQKSVHIRDLLAISCHLICRPLCHVWQRTMTVEL